MHQAFKLLSGSAHISKHHLHSSAPFPPLRFAVLCVQSTKYCQLWHQQKSRAGAVQPLPWQQHHCSVGSAQILPSPRSLHAMQSALNASIKNRCRTALQCQPTRMSGAPIRKPLRVVLFAWFGAREKDIDQCDHLNWVSCCFSQSCKITTRTAFEMNFMLL
jgi:hypothetical protein